MASSTEKKTKKSDEMTLSRALDDFKWAYQYKRSFMKAAEEDMEFALGKQWKDEDVKELEEIGVLPITINEIAPIVQLLHGIESQNRADIRAYPEGGEDSLKADIATRLLKNALSKQAEAQYKVTEAFNDGNMCGESWLEPWMDYSDNLIYANFRIKKSDFTQFFWDPNAREYDLSDGQFLCKVTFDLTKDQILMIYPEAGDLLEGKDGGKLQAGLVNVDRDVLGTDEQKKGYADGDQFNWQRTDVPAFDLLEYFYKKYVDVWYVADGRLGRIREFDSKEAAERFATVANDKDPGGKKLAKAFRRRRPEIWLMAGCGGIEKELANERAWSYPNWRSWPHIPYFARKYTIKFKNESRHLAIQGITRQLKGLNQEKNKRRTQELRHLNQSANSGWLTPENSWVNRDDVEEFGSTPGVNLEYKPELGKPERITPTPLSQGHAQLAQEHSADIKTASGINTELLEAGDTGGADSGRAIALRQKQGLVMVQGLFDNLSRSKKILAKFILTQLPEIFTMERAVRVCGEAFIKDNFSVPVLAPVVDPATGQPVVDPRTRQPAMAPQVDPQTGLPVTQIDQEAVINTFNEVLQDKELAMYDVAVGEVVSQETIQYANYLMLLEMAGKGIPIPPDVLVDQSTLPQDQKAKIQSALQRQSAAAPPAAAKK